MTRVSPLATHGRKSRRTGGGQGPVPFAEFAVGALNLRDPENDGPNLTDGEWKLDQII